jgi:hypothetical protein
MALDDTWGGRDAVTYITEVRADSYIRAAHVFFDEWDQATTAQREAALTRAALNIDARRWHGQRFFYNQLREFPRVPPGFQFSYNVVTRAVPDATFFSFAEQDEYLRRQRLRVEQACCEQALFLLRQAGRHAHREDQFRGIRSVGRGVKFSESFGYGEPDQVLCPEAWDLLRYYKGATRIVRGDAGGLSQLS